MEVLSSIAAVVVSFGVGWWIASARARANVAREEERAKAALERMANAEKHIQQLDRARTEAMQQAEQLRERLQAAERASVAFETSLSERNSRTVDLIEALRLREEQGAAGASERAQLTEQLLVHAERATSATARLAIAEQQMEQSLARVRDLETQLQSQRTADGDVERQLAEARVRLEASDLRTGELTSQHQRVGADLQDALVQLTAVSRRATAAEATLVATADQLEREGRTRESIQQELVALRTSLSEAEQQIATMRAERSKDDQAAQEMARLRDETKTAVQAQLAQLSESIFEEKSRRFGEQNKVMLGDLLSPLREQLGGFEKRIEETHLKDIEQHVLLSSELIRLKELNTALHHDATNLTRALTTQPRTRGAWGELTLTRVLERSGLVTPENYSLQVTGTVVTEDGLLHYRPDAVIHLPENRNLIIDAKLSLNDFLQYSELEDGEARLEALRRHLSSMRQHFSSLSEKAYARMEGMSTPDFVFMFVPIEGAFVTALQQDLELFNEAFAKNVIIVSPSTLLASLRTVANLWRLENQNRNAKEIAAQAGKLFEKFVGFIDDLEKVGKHLGSAQTFYSLAQRKLSTGKGALTGQVEKLRVLGAENPKNKKIPAKWIGDEGSNNSAGTPEAEEVA